MKKLWVLTVCFAIFLIIVAISAFAKDVTLTWDPVVDPALAGYKIYQRPSATPSYTTGSDVGNVTTYTITGLKSGTYCFVATAYDAAKLESDYSNEVCAKLPLASPFNLRVK